MFEVDEIAALAQRVEALEQRQAVLDALHRYSKAIDLGERAEWVDCFTEDGVFDIRSQLPDYPGERYAGVSELRAFIETHSSPPQAHHKHLYVDPDIEIEGGEARASAYFVHLIDRVARPAMISYGRYLDLLRYCPDERWRIAKRIAEVQASDSSARDSRR
jgi:hypothetical protein